MDLYAYLVVLFIVLLFVIILPLLSGVGNFKINKPTSKYSKDKITSKRQKLKYAINDPNVLKFKLSESKKNDDYVNDSSSSSTVKKAGKFDIDSKTGLKRRVIGKYVDNKADQNDPNTFDFDVDELINEDQEEERRDMDKRAQQFKGREEEAYEGFV